MKIRLAHFHNLENANRNPNSSSKGPSTAMFINLEQNVPSKMLMSGGALENLNSVSRIVETSAMVDLESFP